MRSSNRLTALALLIFAACGPDESTAPPEDVAFDQCLEEAAADPCCECKNDEIDCDVECIEQSRADTADTTTADCTEGDTQDKDGESCVCLDSVWNCSPASDDSTADFTGTSSSSSDPISVSPCEDGETDIIDCNSCFCDTEQWICTDEECPETICDSGDVMLDGCNTCVCESNGWICTEIACDPADNKCENDKKKWADDSCNICTCTDEAWVCTEDAC